MHTHNQNRSLHLYSSNRALILMLSFINAHRHGVNATVLRKLDCMGVKNSAIPTTKFGIDCVCGPCLEQMVEAVCHGPGLFYFPFIHAYNVQKLVVRAVAPCDAYPCAGADS